MKKGTRLLTSIACILLAAGCSADSPQTESVTSTVSVSAEASEPIETSTKATEETTTTTVVTTTTTTTTTAVTTTTTTTTTTVTTETPFILETVTIAGEQYQTDVLELDLSWKSLSNSDVENLAKCRKLVSLNLYGVTISNDGENGYSTMSDFYSMMEEKFGFLSEFKDLKSLVIPFGVSFKSIKNQTGLEHLGITSAEMALSNLDLDDLSKLVNLREIDLGGVNMFNPDLTVLKNMPNLEKLVIYDAYFNPYEGDDQMEVLCSLISLKNLYVGDMSDENIQKIQEALPKCVIKRDDFDF